MGPQRAGGAVLEGGSRVGVSARAGAGRGRGSRHCSQQVWWWRPLRAEVAAVLAGVARVGSDGDRRTPAVGAATAIGRRARRGGGGPPPLSAIHGAPATTKRDLPPRREPYLPPPTPILDHTALPLLTHHAPAWLAVMPLTPPADSATPLWCGVAPYCCWHWCGDGIRQSVL